MLSPTAFNIQNWRFVVVRDPEIRRQIRAAAWDQAQVTDASLLIVLCGNLQAWEQDPVRWLQSAPASVRAGVGTAYFDASKPAQTGLVPDVATMVRESIAMLHWMIQTGERGRPARCRSHGFRHILQKGRSA